MVLRLQSLRQLPRLRRCRTARAWLLTGRPLGRTARPRQHQLPLPPRPQQLVFRLRRLWRPLRIHQQSLHIPALQQRPQPCSRLPAPRCQQRPRLPRARRLNRLRRRAPPPPTCWRLRAPRAPPEASAPCSTVLTGNMAALCPRTGPRASWSTTMSRSGATGTRRRPLRHPTGCQPLRRRALPRSQSPWPWSGAARPHWQPAAHPPPPRRLIWRRCHQRLPRPACRRPRPHPAAVLTRMDTDMGMWLATRALPSRMRWRPLLHRRRRRALRRRALALPRRPGRGCRAAHGMASDEAVGRPPRRRPSQAARSR